MPATSTAAAITIVRQRCARASSAACLAAPVAAAVSSRLTAAGSTGCLAASMATAICCSTSATTARSCRTLSTWSWCCAPSVTASAPSGNRIGSLVRLPSRTARSSWRQLGRRATMYATAAARGLIAAGVESAADIDRITAAMREYGVRHDGQQVPLIWAEVGGAGESAAVEDRRPRVKITTTLHVEQAQQAMALAERAAADRTGVLT